MTNRIGLKDTAVVTFFDPKTGEEVVWNKERLDWDRTGNIIVNVSKEDKGDGE